MRTRRALLFFLSIWIVSLSLCYGRDVRVIAERANIYADPDSSSLMIETVEKDTLLFLFQKEKIRKTWYYIAFYSEKYKGKTSGFVQDSKVKLIDHSVSLIQEKKSADMKELKSATAHPIPKKLASAKKQKEKPQEIRIELSSTHLSRKESIEGEDLEVSAYPVRDVVAFEEITEIPAKIKTHRLSYPLRFPTMEIKAFRRIIESSTKIEAVTIPSIDPLLKMEEVPFQRIAKPAVDIKPTVLPSLNPAPKMQDSAFQKINQASQKTKESGIQVEHSPPAKKVIPDKAIETEETKAEEQQEQYEWITVPMEANYVEREVRWVTLGLEFAPSFGGIGGFLQFNTKAGFSFHGGVEYYSDFEKNFTLFNGGAKYYLLVDDDSTRIYLNLQYRGIIADSALIIRGNWDDASIPFNKKKILWGPAFLGGIELSLNRFGLNGAAGVFYNITKLDGPVQEYFLIFNFGLLFHF